MKDPIESLLQGGAQRPGASAADVATMVAGDAPAVGRLVGLLSGADPRVRGGAAESLAALAEVAPEALTEHVPALALALENEETQTRVGAHRALAALAARFPEAIGAEFDTVRLGLFEPANPDIRRYAALCVGRYGAAGEARGRQAFPHLAEALRRFHDHRRPADLVLGMAILARSTTDEWLRAEIWKSARKHEKHEDPEVRALVAEIAGLVRPPKGKD